MRTLKAVFLCWRARMSPARAGVALVYHRVGGDKEGDPQRDILTTVPTRAFEAHLRHLARHYRVVRAAELLDAARRRRRGERFPVAITFDDDLASHVEHVLPALKRTATTATFFVGGVALDGPHSFWWDDLQRAVDGGLVTSLPHIPAEELSAALARRPKAIFRVAATIERLQPAERTETAAALRAAVADENEDDGLRAEGMRMLVDGGCDVGFHTLRHEPLPSLSDEELQRALRAGRERVAEAAGRPLETISYPHGKADGRVADAARDAGYAAGFTTGRAAVKATSDPLLLPRLPAASSLTKTALRVAQAVASSTRP